MGAFERGAGSSGQVSRPRSSARGQVVVQRRHRGTGARADRARRGFGVFSRAASGDEHRTHIGLGIITSQCHLRSGDVWRPLDCCFYLDMAEFKTGGSGVTFSRYAMLSLFEDVVLGECAEGVFIALISPLCAEDDLILMFPDETLSQHKHDYLYKFLKAVIVREKL